MGEDPVVTGQSPCFVEKDASRDISTSDWQS